MHIKFKERQNESVMINVRVVVNSGGYSEKGQQSQPYRVLTISYILIWVAIIGVIKKTKQNKICILYALACIFSSSV